MRDNFKEFEKKALFIVLFLIFSNCFSQSVVGNWLVTDEKQKVVTSIISIQKQGQFYDGKIIKIFETKGVKKVKICQSYTRCKKNKSVLGLTIIQNMVCKNGDHCDHGRILDPRDGDLYHATMRLMHNGNALRVRGYIFIPLLGKSVVWQRMK